MGEYQDIRRPEPPTYRGYTVFYSQRLFVFLNLLNVNT